MSARPTRWNTVVAALHWLNAALILGLLAEGWLMTRAVLDAGTTFDLYQWHKSFGFVALALTAVRLIARALTREPPPVPGWEGKVSRAVQATFYLLTLAAVGAGWLVVSTSPLPVPTKLFGLVVVPNLAAPDATVFSAARTAHAIAVYAIAALVGLHVAGALKHHVADRDDTLRSMWPFGRRL